MNRIRQIEDDLRHWYAHIPDSYHGALRRAWLRAVQGRSKAAAIKAKCQDCVCWQQSEISDCGVYHCPLYPYRPRARDKEAYDVAAERVVARSARQEARGAGVSEQKSKKGIHVAPPENNTPKPPVIEVSGGASTG